MRLTSSIVASLALVAATTGCSVSDEASLTELPPPAETPPNDVSIAFDASGTLTMSPGETTTLEVVTDPPGAYSITFLIVGDATDASLDATTVLAGPDGRASVTLRAPDRAATFVLRARVKDGATADLPVAVSAQGFGTVVVEPEYGGEREVGSWRAGVLTGTSCDALADQLPDDPPGALSAVAMPGEELRIEAAPVGPNLTVYVRASRYMWGCADEKDLSPDEAIAVEVKVFDKPIDLSDVALDIDLDFTPDPGPWATITSAAVDSLIVQLSAGSFAENLLAAMAQQASSPSDFEADALQYGWLATIESHLGSVGFDATTTLSSWAEAGLMNEAPRVTARLDALPDAEGFALLTLDRIGSAAPASLAIPSDYVVAFDADPEDVVHLGGELFFLADAYVGSAVEKEALAATQLPIGDALGEAVGCASLSLPSVASCDQACLEELCVGALASMWAQARAAAGSAAVGDIVMQVSGAAQFDQDASLTGFDGMWLGKVETEYGNADVSGGASAVPTTPKPD